jgi:hypothetical protein
MVAPLAANRAPVDFTIVSFGLAVTILKKISRASRSTCTSTISPADDTAKALELWRAANGGLKPPSRRRLSGISTLRQKYKSEFLVQGCARRFRVLLRTAARQGANDRRIGQELRLPHTFPLRAHARLARIDHAAVVVLGSTIWNRRARKPPSVSNR